MLDGLALLEPYPFAMQERATSVADLYTDPWRQACSPLLRHVALLRLELHLLRLQRLAQVGGVRLLLLHLLRPRSRSGPPGPREPGKNGPERRDFCPGVSRGIVPLICRRSLGFVSKISSRFCRTHGNRGPGNESGAKS